MKEQEMSEHVKHEKSSETLQGDSEVVVLLKKIQQHMIYLEKKIDALSSNNSGGGHSSDRPRPSFPRNNFSSRPPRPFNSHRPDGVRREHRSGERNFSSGQGRPQGQARPFDRSPRPGGGDRDFGAKKKKFFHRDR